MQTMAPESKTLTAPEIQEIVRSSTPERLLGARETEQVDFKRVPYRLEEDRQKFELAKDVSALANASGGVLVLGVQTEKSDVHSWDAASALTPFPRALLDEPRIRATIGAWVYPSLDGITVEVVPRGADAVLATIGVAAQPTSAGPFVVIRTIDERERASAVQFAVYKRRGDESRALSAQELQAILRDGMVLRRILDERSPVNHPELRGVKPTRMQGPPEARMAELTKARLTDLISAAELESSPAFALTATPHPLVDATAILASDRGPPIDLFRNPPELRRSGFDLDAIDPTIHEGRALRALLTGYKAREVWTDGELLFVGTATEEFLSWGQRSPDQPLWVNPLPLIESTLAFCKLAHQLCGMAPSPPSHMVYSIQLLRMGVAGKAPRLNTRFMKSQMPVVGPDVDFERVLVKSFDQKPSAVALALVREVFAWFKQPHDRVPFVKGDEIDEAQILALG
jgi:hypothetical protein